MSTRCNVIIKDRVQELIFYRHYDGDPESVLPSLEKFIGWAKEGRIRDNARQASGWLIRLGASEYETPEEPRGDHISGWKVGAYEPTAEIDGDINFLYVVDVYEKTIQYEGEGSDYKYEGKFKT